MRTNSQTVQHLRGGNGLPALHRLDEIFDSIVVMRWYLNNALHEAADVPEAASESLKKVLRELDVSIAAMKMVPEKRRWASQERRDA
jgi:hypothetical protein